MAIVRLRRSELNPFKDFLDMQSEVNRFFDLNLGRLSTPTTSWVPAIDVYEDKDEVKVKAEVPGMEEKDIDLSLEGNILTLRGEKKFENEVKEEDYYRVERSFGKFQRSLELPSDVDANAVKATYKNGVLEIRLPKKEEIKPKQVKIEVEK
jgi:HSP20 family protein